MPIVNGSYQQRSTDEILENLETELRNEFGEDIDLTESSVFSDIAQMLATVTNSNQEQDLQEVYESAFLDTATGIDLERVVSIIGIQRRSARNATGVQRFSATGRVTQNYVIQSGTTVQTDNTDPVQFETTEPSTLQLIDSFEDDDLSPYSGDTASASIIEDVNATDGSNVLQLDATDGAHIYNDDIIIKQGGVYHCDVRPQTDTVPTVTFGIDPTLPSDYYQVAVDEDADEVRLEVVDDETVVDTIDTATTVGLTADEFHEVEIAWNTTDNIGITIYDTDDNELADLGGEDSTYTEGYTGFKSGDAIDVKEFDWYTTSIVSANIRALRGGTDGNIGRNSITRMPSPPTGVDTTTNPFPTGDTEYTDRDQVTFTSGEDEETDDALRERAEDAVTGGGDATHDSIVSELVNNVTGVNSVTIYENKTDDDNTGSGGLPPHSFEAVVFGGTDVDIAQAIFDKKAITAYDYGGVNGTEVTVNITSDINGQVREITFSRPTEVSVDITLDLIIDENYVGDDDIRNQLTQYIGGTLTNGSEVIGLDVQEDVVIDRLQDIAVGSENGVVGLDQSVDGSPIETTPSHTTVDGLDVIEIGETEVAQTDATDTSITINTREQ